MARQLYVNLPVADLARSARFFADLGFTFDADFTDDSTACMVVNDSTSVLLHTHERYAEFTDQPIADPTASSAAMYCVSADSRDDADRLLRSAAAGGGTIVKAGEAQGPMYGGTFADPDGHRWEVAHMDMAALAALPQN